MTNVNQIAGESIRARTVLHIDMDAFYVAVEVRRNPSLAGKPVVVGGDGERGVVASCSYEARAYGITSAMPSTQAKRRCPNAIFLQGDHALYGEVSTQLHEVFHHYTPMVEGIALDEAFLDVTAARKLHGDGPTIAAKLRAEIADSMSLPCSVGVATSKLVAKLASKAAKPPIGGAEEKPIPGGWRPSKGVVEIMAGGERSFMHPQSVRALWGVGPKTFERLARFGVQTVGDLAALPEDTLVRALGDANGRHLHLLANAVDDRPVEPQRGVKSIGHEETFSVDHRDLDVLHVELLRMADAVGSRLRAAELVGRTVQLKIKLSDFESLTRSKTLPQPIVSSTTIVRVADALMRRPDVADRIAARGARLLGVSVSGLASAATTSAGEASTLRGASGADDASSAVQLDLFGAPVGDDAPPTTMTLDELGTERADERQLAKTVDAIRAKFGEGAVASATLVSGDGLRVKRRGDTQWGPSGDG